MRTHVALAAARERLASLDPAVHADVIAQLDAALNASGPDVPEELVTLSAKATPDWTATRIPSVLLGGPVKTFECGSGQTQIASFTAPIDCDDPEGEQRANAALALAAVNFVRRLIG